MNKLRILVILLSILSLSLNTNLYAQSNFSGLDYKFWHQMSIGKGDNTATSTDAWLEIGKYGTTKGMILPRGSRFGINPVEGNFLYHTGDKSIYYGNGIGWIKLLSDASLEQYDSAYVRAEWNNSTRTLRLIRLTEDFTDVVINGQTLSLVGNALSISGGNSVNLFTTNVTEGSNLYFTNARARQAINLTNGLTYNNSTGVGVLGGEYTTPIQINTNNASEFMLEVGDGAPFGSGVINRFQSYPTGFSIAAYDFPNNRTSAMTILNNIIGINANNVFEGINFVSTYTSGVTSKLLLGKNNVQTILSHETILSSESILLQDTTLNLSIDSSGKGTSIQQSHNYVAISAFGPRDGVRRKVYINANPFMAEISDPKQFWMLEDTTPVQIGSPYQYTSAGFPNLDTSSRLVKIWGRTTGRPAVFSDEYITKAQLDATGSGTVFSVGLTSSDITVGGTSPITTSGTFTLTLPNINANVGTFNNLTVNAKGQVTAASNVSYELAANKVTSLSSPNNTTYPTTLAVSNAISAIPSYWTVSGTDDITNTNAGYVNIGGGTFSSAYKFTVTGSSAFTGSLDLHSPTSHYGFSNFDIGYATLGYQSGTAKPIYISATSDGGNQIVLNTDDNVGIGTTTPASKLEVNGITTTTAVYSPNLSDLVLWSQNGDHMNFAVGNSSTKMSLDDNGRLGIGTIPNSLRASLLEVEGNAWATDAWILGTGTTPLAEFGLSGGAFVRTMTATNLDFIINAGTLVARANGTNANFEISNQIKIAGGNPGIGKVLTDSDGNGLGEWTTIGGGSGTVTSVGISSTDLSVSGSPITTSGSITLNVNNDAITYAKLQNVTATRLLGRYTGSNGDAQEITIGSGLSLNSGTGELTATGSGGTVTSVGLTSSDITIGGTSPITNSGTFTLTLPNIVTANTFNNITFNAKGQVTGGSNVAYLTSESDPVANAKTVTLTNGTGISISGAAQAISANPAFTITNTAPDQTVVLTNGTGITISGTYPNFTITNAGVTTFNGSTGAITHTPGSAFTPTLTGANVLSTFETNASGHVTTLTTRTLTASDIGAAPSGLYSIVLADFYTDEANSSGTPDEVMTYNVSTTRMGSNGNKLRIIYSGTASTGVGFGISLAGNQNLFTTGGSGTWRVEVDVIRVSNSIIRYSVIATTGGVGASSKCDYQEITGLNLSVDGLDVAAVVNSGSPGEAVATMGAIIFLPSAPAP